jgi:hypothetical protein
MSLLSRFHVLPLFFRATSSALCVPLPVTSVVRLRGIVMAFPCISANSAYLTWCSMQLIPLWLSGGVKGVRSSPCAPLAYSFFPTKQDLYKSFSNGSPSTAPPYPPPLYLATMATLYFGYFIITRSQFFHRFIVFVGDFMVVLLCL